MHAHIDTPFGGLDVAVSGDGVSRVNFTRGGAATGTGADPLLARAVAELERYLAGGLKTFTVPLDWTVTSGWQREVLQVLHETVGFGQVVTYQELASRAGQPDGARAVGGVMGSNPLPLIVPCHRVVAAHGQLGGFGGGLRTKRWLLAHEGVLPAELPFG